MHEAQISLSGYVATQPRWRGRDTQNPNVTMRVAWTPRRLDRATGEWADGHTSYASVYCWRKLAENAAICLRKGDPIVLKGRLSVREYTAKDGTPRTEVEVAAVALGHDLNRGVAQFARTRLAAGKTADELAADGGDLSAGPDPSSAPLGDPVLAAAAGPDGPDGPGEPGGHRPDTDAGADSGEDLVDAEAIDELAADADSVAAPF
jgi:single-strand DNA-binding protein